MKQFVSKIMPIYLLVSIFSCRASVQHGCSADYVIVGFGTAGATLAAYLSNDSVVVLESGIDLNDDPNVQAATIFQTEPLSFNPYYSKTYADITWTTEDQGSQYLIYTDGRLWGGGSSHNGLQAYRGTPTIYNQWASITGDPQWAYNNLLANDMLFMEHYTPDDTTANPAQRGLSGPLFITQEPPVNGDPFMKAVVNGLTGANQFVDDLNDPTNDGANAAPNYLNVGIGSNQDWVTPPWASTGSVRSSSATAFYTGVNALNPDGFPVGGSRQLRVISQATVSRVLFSGTTAIGVEYFLEGNPEQVYNVYARKKVILSAGTISDAAILQRSGIGNPTLLNSLGIPVVYANNNVGINVQNQSEITAIIEAGEDHQFELELIQIGSGFIDLYPYETPANVRRFQIAVIGIPAEIPLSTLSVLDVPPNAITYNGGDVTPPPSGTITIVSTDPFVDPIINNNWYTDGPVTTPGTQSHKAVSFYLTARDVATAASGSVLYPPAADYTAYDGGNPVPLLNDAMNVTALAYHRTGSCRMAASASTGVVDSNLNVFGVSNLMCVDDSILPVIVDCNTAYPAFVVGLQAAHILGVL